MDVVDVGGQRSAEEALWLVGVVQEPDLQRDQAVRAQVDHLPAATPGWNCFFFLFINHDG